MHTRRRSTVRAAGVTAVVAALALAAPAAARADDATVTLDELWAICSPDAPRVELKVSVSGTAGTTTLEASILAPGATAPTVVSESVEYPEVYWINLNAPGGAGDYRFSVPRAGVQDEVVRFPDDCYSPFVDVPVDYVFIDHIIWMADAGISTGWDLGDGTFAYDPWGDVKRDAMAAFLYRFAGEPDYTPLTRSPFADVSTTSPFYKEISWLAEHGITTGWNVNGRLEYRPYSPITRDAMAAFLYRFAEEPAYSAPTPPFADVTPSSSFAKEITWLAAQGVTTGWVVNGRAEFRPFQNIKRDAMAAFLSRFADTFEE